MSLLRSSAAARVAAACTRTVRLARPCAAARSISIAAAARHSAVPVPSSCSLTQHHHRSFHLHRRACAAVAVDPASSASASSASSSSTASSPPDAEPINPEEYAARHGFADDDDDGFGEENEIPYRDPELDAERREMADRICAAALPMVLESGGEWSLAVLRRAASSLGLSPASIGVLGSDPQATLVWYVMRKAHREMCDKVEAANKPAQEAAGTCSRASADPQQQPKQQSPQPQPLHRSTSSRLSEALMFRLQCLQPYQSFWPQALAIVSTPSNLPESTRRHFAQVDELWHALGDRATDSEWYVKRALMAGVAASAELFWLTDRSAGSRATRAFLRRQLEIAGEAAKVPGQIEEAARVVCNVGNTLWQRCGVKGRGGSSRQ